MDDAADVARAFAPQDVERVGRSVARVDDDRLLQLAREADEPREGGALHVARGVVVVVVEADLADGDDLGLGREPRELGVRGVVEGDGVVRVHADRSAGSLVHALRERDRRARRREIGADADDDEALHAGLACAGEHLVGPAREVLRIEMAVRIDEHGRKP